MDEYFIIEASGRLDNTEFDCFFRGIDKVTNSYRENDGSLISFDKIDVIMTPTFQRAKRFKYAFEAETWLKKLLSSDCDYTQFKFPLSFSIVFCRGEDKVVVWETRSTIEGK